MPTGLLSALSYPAISTSQSRWQIISPWISRAALRCTAWLADVQPVAEPHSSSSTDVVAITTSLVSRSRVACRPVV